VTRNKNNAAGAASWSQFRHNCMLHLLQRRPCTEVALSNLKLILPHNKENTNFERLQHSVSIIGCTAVKTFCRQELHGTYEKA